MKRFCVLCLSVCEQEPTCFVCECGPSFFVRVVGYAASAGSNLQLVRPELPEPQPQAEATCR